LPKSPVGNRKSTAYTQIQTFQATLNHQTPRQSLRSNNQQIQLPELTQEEVCDNIDSEVVVLQ
jgi:hypothetical protein